jgi:ankyrin repeat protein
VHSDGLTALHCAAIHGNLRIVRLLIESNAAVGAQDFGG